MFLLVCIIQKIIKIEKVSVNFLSLWKISLQHFRFVFSIPSDWLQLEKVKFLVIDYNSSKVLLCFAHPSDKIKGWNVNKLLNMNNSGGDLPLFKIKIHFVSTKKSRIIQKISEKPPCVSYFVKEI